MRNENKININGTINGIVNLGNNSININKPKAKNEPDENSSEESDISKTELKKDKISSKVFKIMGEIIIGVVISLIAGYILYKLNMN